MPSRLTNCAVSVATLLLTTGSGHTSASPKEVPSRPEAAKVHIIPLERGMMYISRFKDTRDALYRQAPELKARLDIPSSESFSRSAIASLLNQRDSLGNPAAGIRIYFGLDAGGQVRLILVSYDSRGINIIQPLSSEKGEGLSPEGGGEVIEDGLRCPPACPDEENSLGGNQEASALDAARNHIISAKEAAAYTARFRSTWNEIPRQIPGLSTRLNFIRSESFNRDAIAVLLNQRDGDGNLATGIRIHFGLDFEGQIHLVLTPHDAQGRSIIGRLSESPSTGTESEGDGEVIEDGQRCPPSCGALSNSILDEKP
jgi:hypothetical protein